MNGRPLTDVRISQALRAHLPQRAPAGLRGRILDAAETTTLQRMLPAYLGALSDADPVARRRSLLIAAALLVALAVASAAAVGALRLLQRDPVDQLSLEPPADVPAFVLSSYERLLQLPPVALAWHDSGSAKGRIYVDRSGAVRFDRFTSADATEPSSYTILSGNRISGMALVDSEAVWIEPGHEAVDDNAREYIRSVLNAGGNVADAPGCEMERDPSEVGDGSAATGWRYVGVEYVAGRPTHHVACVGALSVDTDLWLDIETRLILRIREPVGDDSGQPIPGQFETTEVTEIEFAEQPAALFEAPEGMAHLTSDAYGAYLCARDVRIEEEVGLGVRDCSTPEAEATPPPTATPMPTVRPSLGPRPSGPAGPLAWTPASLQEDWPASVRREPAGGSSVLPMPLTHMDPTGDTGSDIDPWVDIRAVMGDTRNVHLKLDSNQPPEVDPAELWIAYGVVTDEDRDGVPDWRYGIDNVPIEPDALSTRVWRTNLHTGRTDDRGFLSEGYKGAWPRGADADFEFGGTMDVAGQGTSTWGITLDMPFYTWASVIVNGRVVATDYAPDAGWLVATPGAKPGGTYLLDDPFPLRLSMSVPDGWAAGGPYLMHTGTGDEQDGRLEIVKFDHHPTWSCDASGDGVEAQFGPKVDDLVTFLQGVQTIKISENTDVTLDGYRGKYLEITTNTNDDCHMAPDFNQAWIIDVNGVRLVIGAYSTSSEVKSELRQIVGSIRIEP